MLKYQGKIICVNKKECWKTNCKGCLLFNKPTISCEKHGCPKWLKNLFIKAGAKENK
jgi:hypothetical protein